MLICLVNFRSALLEIFYCQNIRKMFRRHFVWAVCSDMCMFQLALIKITFEPIGMKQTVVRVMMYVVMNIVWRQLNSNYDLVSRS